MLAQDAAEPATGSTATIADAAPAPHADRRLLIDGRLVSADTTFPSINPATGAAIGHAPDAGAAEAEAAIAAARRAFDTTDWPTDVELRIRCLNQLHRALVEHADQLRALTIAEVGATRALTQGAQLDEPIGIVRFYADLLRTCQFSEDLGERESRGMLHHRWVEKEAAGVVGAIIAYNTFTGSTEVGRKIMAASSQTIKRVFLELGGKSAAIMLDDADFANAALFAAFSMVTHAGQGYALTSRLLVPKSHHDEIVELIAQNFAKVSHGDPANPKTYMGPLINERQRDKVDGMVQRAVAAGATLVTGGKRLDPGYFYAPTLLTNVDPDSEIAQEEIFGPVLVVIAFDDDDDAVRIANNSIYGLAGAVFSRDQDRALAVARRIRTGSFSINGGNYFGADSPFGGFKQSGVGHEMGVAGLDEFLERKTYAVPALKAPA